MKALKIVAFVVGGIVLLLAIGLLLALTPSVQTWAVRKAVAGQPGMKLDVARVAAGFSAADIADLRFEQDGIVVTAKAVSARYNAWDYVSKKRINADSVTVQDLVVDLRNAKPAAAQASTMPATGSGATRTRTPAEPPIRSGKPAEKKTPFDGVLKQAQLPFDVRVATLAAKGRALLPGDQTVVFDVKGDNIETGQRGKLEWTVDFADATRDAALRALRATGTATLHIAADRRIDSVEVDTVAAAMGPKLPSDRVKLSAKAEQPTAGGNETYAATVALMRGNAIEPLLKTNAQFLTATREIAGTWEIAIRSEQLAGLLAGFGLPEIAANGAGKFNLKPETNAVAASGDLQGQVSQLQKLSPALEAVGAMKFNTSFDGGFADNVARLEKFNLEVTGADGRKFAQVSSLQRVAYNLNDQKVTLADPKAEVARISVQQLPLAWAQPMAKPMIIESGDLSLALAVEAEPDGSRVRARSLEPLVVRNVTVRDEKKKPLIEQVTLSTRPSVDYSGTRVVAQLADLRVSMPAGDTVAGTVSADVTNLGKTPAIAFTAQLQAKIVQALKPYLPVDTGPLAAKIDVEGRHEGQTLQLTKATSVVNREGGGLIGEVVLQQPIRADLAKSTFAAAKPSEIAARVRLGEIPLAWAEPFVAKSKFAGALNGGTLEVTMRSVDDLTLTTSEPVTVRGVSATIDGKPMAQSLDLFANLTATKRGNTIAYEVRKVELKQGDASLATLAVAGEVTLGGKSLVVSAKGNLDADVVALMRQPVLAPYATLSRGRVSAAFDANLAEAIQTKAVISAKNLVAKQDSRALGDLDLKLDASMKADGTGTINLPLTLASAARKSDVSIVGAFGKAQNKDTFLFTGKITSSNFIVDDFQPLASLAPAGEPAKPAPMPAPRTPTTVVRAPTSSAPARDATPGRDTAPFWKAVNGKVDVDLKHIVYGKDYVISNVRGTAMITDSKLSLDGLEGRFKENPFKLAGGVTFAANQPKPYALSAAADVQNFDVGAFLRAANPNEKPALETKATVTARLSGNGGTIGDLGKNAYGKFEVTGTKGVMYLLERKGSAGTAVNIASFGLAILGAARGSDTATALSELTRMLNSVAFDSVKMQIERAPDLTFKLTSLEVLSPILRTTGNGTVMSKSTDDLANAPMNIMLQLGAKGELAYLLQRVGMLGAKQDEKGYQLMTRSFTVGGTTGKPDNSALWRLLGEAALGALAR